MIESINDFIVLNYELFVSMVSMALGGLITWFAARHYYVKASKELLSVAEELQKLSVWMLRAMEIDGKAKFARDDNGNIKGIEIGISGGVQASSATVGGEVKSPR